ncbi:MAG TPA: exodeoxyribonuclease VII small subunit [Candidatus Saccharibacteria bacterium]|nr:exodeoxyribonuclease VII small subunit [Candidatus Saccharibacteria bacterium]
MADNYQTLNQELAEIIDTLQSAEIDIDEALRLHKRGQDIVHQLEVYLKKAENIVKKHKTTSS